MIVQSVLILSFTVSANFFDDVGDGFDNIESPGIWKAPMFIFLGLMVGLVIVGLFFGKKIWKKCKKHYKKAKKQLHKPLIQKENHHYSLHHETPLHHLANPHGQVHSGYINPNSYPYIPPPNHY